MKENSPDREIRFPVVWFVLFGDIDQEIEKSYPHA
jgi:hypothetical protein